MMPLVFLSRRAAAGAVVASLLLGGCVGPGHETSAAPSSSETTSEPIELTSNVEAGASGVAVDTLVEASLSGGSLDSVRLTGRNAEGRITVPGSIEDGTWTAGERLEPGADYTLVARGNDDAPAETMTRRFSTADLTLDDQTYPAVAPLDGETVGVGMPVVVTFDLPVRNKKLFEQHMTVTTDAGVEGSWNWLSSNEAHYRPQDFWPAGTEVTVDIDVNGLPAGGGIFGQQDQNIGFTVGDRVVTTVDVAGHSLTMKRNGKKVRSIPVSTGKRGFRTRRGTKIIMEKYDAVDMDAASTGISEDDPEYYDMENVQWAMRVTNSGEFLHAAPWSVGSQGRANVSHGCVGMSTRNAKWLYDRSRRGDVVQFVNTPRPLESGNGWTDWNTSWSQWKAGSALG